MTKTQIRFRKLLREYDKAFGNLAADLPYAADDLTNARKRLISFVDKQLNSSQSNETKTIATP